MDRWAWRAKVHGVATSLSRPSDYHLPAVSVLISLPVDFLLPPPLVNDSGSSSQPMTEWRWTAQLFHPLNEVRGRWCFHWSCPWWWLAWKWDCFPSLISFAHFRSELSLLPKETLCFEFFFFFLLNSFVFNFIYLFIFVSWPCHMAYGILVPPPGIEPVPPALEES